MSPNHDIYANRQSRFVTITTTTTQRVVRHPRPISQIQLTTIPPPPISLNPQIPRRQPRLQIECRNQATQKTNLNNNNLQLRKINRLPLNYQHDNNTCQKNTSNPIRKT